MVAGQKLCLVAKANCYGLGIELIKYIDCFADYFAVSSAEEFFEAKKYTDRPILILSPQYHDLKKLIVAGAELTVCDSYSLRLAAMAAGECEAKCRVHVAVNTGMNRLGFKSKKEFKKIIEEIKKSPNLQIIGVFSHYFDANCDFSSLKQYYKFLEFERIYYSVIPQKAIFHIASSGGVFNINGFDMVRCGMELYTDKRQATITFKSKIIAFQNLQAGESAGYGGIFVAEQKCRLAVVAVGYGDGIFRRLAGRATCLINGRSAKIVAVCMDSILVDVTTVAAKIDDDVVLIGKSGEHRLFICDMARCCDTIDYEIIVRISERVKRKYINCNYADNKRKVSFQKIAGSGRIHHKAHAGKSKGVDF